MYAMEVLRWVASARCLLIITAIITLASIPCEGFSPSLYGVPNYYNGHHRSPTLVVNLAGGSSSSLSSVPSLSADMEMNQNTIQSTQVQLDSGVCAEVMYGLPSMDEDLTSSKNKNSNKSPLVFIHGSFHAAWCWAEHYMPYFMNRGYFVAALSLRGTGGTFAGEGIKKVKIAEHVQDIEALLKYISCQEGFVKTGNNENDKKNNKPIIIAHSFGGLGVMKYLEKDPTVATQTLGGIILMCSVPPSGNGKMTMRFLKRSLVDSWKITAGLAMKKCIQNESLARELFFGGRNNANDDNNNVDDAMSLGISDEDVRRYQTYFKRDTVATIDLMDLSKQLPSAIITDESSGCAPFVSHLPPCAIFGATDDFIVDMEGVKETAAYFGLSEPIMIDSPHDVMLGAKWENGASAILQWIEHNVETD
mmetsp:Transcript_21366/g.38618  ORF Transcript_21366/g.38618 Transcript_21366/m.38618 type:complete len:420 (-) Transcript_21366:93-1352(-)